MVKNLLLLLFLLASVRITAQDTQYFENFENSISSKWSVTGSTFSISHSSGTMQVTYNRKSTSGQWDQFSLSGINVKTESPYISLDLSSNVAFKLAVKPVSATSNDWLEALVPADNQWHNYIFQLSATANEAITNIYIYFDGGSTATISGSVQIDNFHLGIKDLPKDTTLLHQLITAALLFETNIIEGEHIGQFPAGSKNAVAIVSDSARSLIFINKDLSQGLIDSAAFDLYNQLLSIEISANKPAEKLLIDTLANLPTYNLYKNLKTIASNRHSLFGMHDATAYGIGWTYDGVNDKSDVKMVTGSHPAILSQDINDIIRNSFSALEPFKKRQMDFYLSGGINTLVWHMDDPKYKTFYYNNFSTAYNAVASILPSGDYHSWYKNNLRKLALYLKSFKGPKGESVPFIFRPFHEHNGDWFWWGKGRCSVNEYNELWQFTVHYLRDSLNVHNLIYAFSPDGNQYSIKQDYKAIYPGDNYVDVFGLDYYFGENSTSAMNKLKTQLNHICEFANETDKLAALTEFGDRLHWDDDDMLEIPAFYTRMILAAMKGIQNNSMIAYAATWRNGHTKHFFAPYPGHAQVPDFLDFFDDTTTLFLNDVNNLYSFEPVDIEDLSCGSRMKSFTVNGKKAIVDVWKPQTKNYMIKLSIPDTMDVSAVIPEIQISENAQAKINGAALTNTPLNLENEIKYVITAQNAIDSSVYTLQVSRVLSTSIKETNEKKTFFYPNPVSDILNVVSDGNYSQIELYNNMGQNILKSSLQEGPNQINIKDVPQGIYLIKIIGSGKKTAFLIKK